jgi:hypothetical protein
MEAIVRLLPSNTSSQTWRGRVFSGEPPFRLFQLLPAVNPAPLYNSPRVLSVS